MSEHADRIRERLGHWFNHLGLPIDCWYTLSAEAAPAPYEHEREPGVTALRARELAEFFGRGEPRGDW